MIGVGPCGNDFVEWPSTCGLDAWTESEETANKSNYMKYTVLTTSIMKVSKAYVR